ncbi:MAG: MFS transporter [Rhodoglobus sp.]
MNSRRAWVMLTVGIVAYIVSVMQRTSLSVAAVQATDRFGITAAALSTLAVAQLAVYAAMQVPAGLLLDRFGPRRMLAAGAVVMVIGQVLLALSPSLGGAVVGRVLVGAGDAATFISVLRVAGMWFSRSRLPLLTQIIGVVGAGGQILSAFPLFALLHTAGWAPAYLSAAGLSVFSATLVLLTLRSGPADAGNEAISIRETIALARDAVSRPGTQLGFWSHFVSAGPGNMFALLWGFPFLSVGLGYGPGLAAVILTLNVATSAVVGPAIGTLTSRFPLRRSAVVIAVVLAMGVAWGLVLGWPGIPPLPLVVVLVVVISAGGSASLIGLDFARTFNERRAHGTVSGFANVGGFTAAFTMMFLIGLALDALDRIHGGHGEPSQLYSFESFRVAFLLQYLVVGIGIVFLLRARRATRARMLEEEGIEVPPLWVALVKAWRRTTR